jgi:hypothetical protein
MLIHSHRHCLLRRNPIGVLLRNTPLALALLPCIRVEPAI